MSPVARRAGLAPSSWCPALGGAPVPWVWTASAAVKKKPAPKNHPEEAGPEEEGGPEEGAKKKKVVVDVPPLPPGRTCYRAPLEVPERPFSRGRDRGVPTR